jgi:hypothetical protein
MIVEDQPRAHASRRARREAASSIIRADSRSPSPCGRPNQLCFGFDRDGGLAAWPRAIIERRQRAFGHRPLNAALHGLVMRSERLAQGKKRGVFPIGQQYPCPLDAAGSASC